MYIYVDGVLKNSMSCVMTLHNRAVPLLLGTHTPGLSNWAFRGRADTIAVWDTAFSASEILSLYAYEGPTTIGSPVGVWTFSREMGRCQSKRLL